ncbi:meiosis induction protein kinase-like protein [Mytilinidion resinicola]|uniref:Meiosis induction protein kinase-like protein n=1 Tax=Mytilinidion resinicola TaxID=574789 RepID=A0A6A6YZL8_9PEZI|nr:meiosis induction protein kinase-like protein [Mytilinidion resinicola]KAF2813365.1 meiosis induction protein kinase-like protein [Mytilinidion resinicola]
MIAYETQHRGWSSQDSQAATSLDDKFEVIKDIGDGSFGSVALARVRGAGAHIARRGTLVAIKTMKKSFDSFAHCLELREVIFLRTLPNHPHLVPALDIFLDPYSRRLHIAMEYMDGNLYQLMKARDHKPLDQHSVKSILFQIISGLEHIHQHDFFHRDIKPENILVSTSAPTDSGSAFRRYSALVTPPSTPPAYTIKIADFGLARETHSKLPYTTYVSTRWYRAPEVLLRAGEYSAPVDIWAIGAMAVEIATLKPLFPGGNEVDQVWRVCEIMGSPGSWVNKQGVRVGGGDWKDGVRLAQKLGFSFPKMAPHSMDTILQAPQWPASLANFVTWCLMWDPRSRPTSSQALSHEYFADAFDPMRPKSSASRLLGRKQSDLSGHTLNSPDSTHSLTTKTSSWFRRSLVARESAPAVPQHTSTRPVSPRPSPIQAVTVEPAASSKPRPNVTKRATWTNGVPSNAAPIPILPSIRPISPLSDTVTARASVRPADSEEKAAKKIGRQLSVASHGNHYADLHRQEAERALNGQSGLASPPNGQKEGFFSHLRKRARRLSGRYQAPMSPNSDDIEANAGCAPWSTTSARGTMAVDPSAPNPPSHPDYADLDKALQNVRYSLDAASHATNNSKTSSRVAGNPGIKRHHSLPHGQETRSSENAPGGPISSRTRRALQKQSNPSNRYETPNEEEELLDEELNSTAKATRRLAGPEKATAPIQGPRPQMGQSSSDMGPSASYLTPSPSANRDGVNFGHAQYATPSKPMNINRPHPAKEEVNSKWPTPPYDENDWAASATASIFNTQAMYR